MNTNADAYPHSSSLVPWRMTHSIRELAERKPRAEVQDFPSMKEYAAHKNAMSTALRDIRRMLAYIESDASGLSAGDLQGAMALIPCLSRGEPGEPLRCFPWHPKLRAMLCASLMTVLVRDAATDSYGSATHGTTERLKKHLGPGCVARWWP